jgi:hypothetical protein
MTITSNIAGAVAATHRLRYRTTTLRGYQQKSAMPTGTARGYTRRFKSRMRFLDA